MTRDPVDRNQLDADHDTAETAQEAEQKASVNQSPSYPAAVVYTMLSRGLRDPRAYADVLRKYPHAWREIFVLLNNAFGMAFAQSIMKVAENPAPATATSQASRPDTPAVAAAQHDSRGTRDVTTAESQDTSRHAAGDPAPDGSSRVSFSVPATYLDIDDAGRTCPLADGTGVVATSTPAVVQAPAVNGKVQTAAANKSVASSTTTTSPAQSGHSATASGMLPTGSPVDHKPDHGAGPSVTAPKNGINKAGFIDNSDGANLRTGPAELGGQKVRDLPLPPGSRVFVSGTHPDASHWWYVTAYLNETMVRGYVQDFRVTMELPEPTAKLHQVVSGDTAELLAAQEYGSSVRDGHDLRYYENVLLYVNQQQRRAGIIGSYQDPGILGGGSNNVQLMAGHRIWLVSPAYARALETVVPTGSLTGGAVAKVKRFVGHLEDILHSVTRCPHYFGEVAGEYAQAIRDHEAEIIGITAGFIMAEATSMFLAATPTGVGQIAAVVIQLALSAFGAAGALQAGVEALKHATEWLTIAWTARGKDDVIAAASKEFLKMLVGIAMAALSARGAKANYHNALKIASSMPTGGLPVLAFAHGGQSGGDAGGTSGTGVSVEFGPGAVGAAGNAMQRVGGDEEGVDPERHFDDYGDNASYKDDPADWRADSERVSRTDDEINDIGLAEPGQRGTLEDQRVRHVSKNEVAPELASEHGVSVLHEARLDITRNPRHHTLPQEEIAFFQARGFPGREIDKFCVELPKLDHELLHGGNQSLARRFWKEREWNTELMRRLRESEAEIQHRNGPQAKLSRDRILKIMEGLRIKFKIDDLPFVEYEADASSTGDLEGGDFL